METLCLLSYRGNSKQTCWLNGFYSALPVSSLPLCRQVRKLGTVAGEGFEPPKATPADLQSDPFGRLGNPPRTLRHHKRLSNRVQHTKTLARKVTHFTEFLYPQPLNPIFSGVKAGFASSAPALKISIALIAGRVNKPEHTKINAPESLVKAASREVNITPCAKR